MENYNENDLITDDNPEQNTDFKRLESNKDKFQKLLSQKMPETNFKSGTQKQTVKLPNESEKLTIMENIPEQKDSARDKLINSDEIMNINQISNDESFSKEKSILTGQSVNSPRIDNNDIIVIETKENLITKTVSQKSKKSVKIKYNNNQADNLVDNIMKGLDEKTQKRLDFRRTQTTRKETQSDAMKIVDNIVQNEISLPDDVLVSELFKDFKIYEFISSLFTLICKRNLI
jgi:hypothetical protein